MESLKTTVKITWLAGVVALLVPAAAEAAPLAALLARQQAGEPLVWIDVRTPAQFARAHVPGAINVPARVLPEKRIPALGEVVVYGDGLDQAAVDASVQALAAVPGVRPTALDGGFPVWQESGQPIVGERGLAAPDAQQVTLREITEAVGTNPNLELVELRRAPPRETVLERGPLSSLARTSQRRASDDEALGSILRRWRSNPTHTLVLVDDGDGRAERLAQRLRAAGAYRVAVLIGGGLATENDGTTTVRTLESRPRELPAVRPAAKGGAR